MTNRTSLLAAALAVTLAGPAFAQSADFTALEIVQNAANAKPGPRSLPPRVIPVPQDVSPAAQATGRGRVPRAGLEREPGQRR